MTRLIDARGAKMQVARASDLRGHCPVTSQMIVHCRFQACAHITRLLATTKRDGVVYHVLEPIQCSLRHHLSSRPRTCSTVTSLRRLLLQLLRGLDYLHDRGWVHFDLSLDTVAVSVLARLITTPLSRKITPSTKSVP